LISWLPGSNKVNLIYSVNLIYIMTTVVKVKKETARELAMIAGKLAMKRRKKVSYDEAIRFLLEKDREQRPVPDLKDLIKKSFHGASFKDFEEYAYEDV